LRGGDAGAEGDDDHGDGTDDEIEDCAVEAAGGVGGEGGVDAGLIGGGDSGQEGKEQKNAVGTKACIAHEVRRVLRFGMNALMLAAGLACAVGSGWAAVVPPEQLTIAERTEFRATARHADVVAVMEAIAKGSPLARMVSMGKTTEGRDIPVLVMSDPPVASAAEAMARAKGGAVVLLAFGNIHAGEVDGKEALPMLARELLSERKGILKDAVVCFAPIYNADGNERVSKTNRPGQVGPEEGMGIRENANGRDLNRDFVKVEEAETRALIGFMNEWDPHVVIDCHTTNGSYHRYVLTYAGPKVPAGNAGLNQWARRTFMPRVDADFEARSGTDAFWYGSFEGAFTDAPRGHTRWETFPAEARYGTNYIGLRNRMGVLSEAYAYATFQERVMATKDFVESVLQVSVRERESLTRVLRQADEEMLGAWSEKKIALRTEARPQSEKVTILGFEEEMADGRMHNTGREKEYEVELWDNFAATLERMMPRAYAMLPLEGKEATPERVKAMGKVLEALRVHGIETTTLAQDAEMKVTRSRVREARSAGREYQGHVAVRVSVTDEEELVKLPKGTVVISTQQRLGRLAAYLLEPECEDGLTTWNYFDAWLQIGEKFPVMRIGSAINLGGEPRQVPGVVPGAEK